MSNPEGNQHERHEESEDCDAKPVDAEHGTMILPKLGRIVVSPVDIVPTIDEVLETGCRRIRHK